MKNRIKLLSMALAFIMLTLTGNLIADGASNDNCDAKKYDWIQYSKARPKVVPASLELTLEGGVSEIGTITGDIIINQRFEYVDCCMYNRDKYSWCNKALQDKRC